ncbi:MAG: helix-turn-helix domain-containing protein, partial [Anaerolineales bacterium]
MPVTSVSFVLDHFTTFGDLLKYLRRSAGLTQKELSIAVGYSESQISRLEHNERLPDLPTVTARFLPALMLEDQPEMAERLLELAASVRREDAPAFGLPPYKGLYHFDEHDAEMFFGREDLTATLVEQLLTDIKTDQRFLAIIGASGSGKSSLVRAGLIPSLRWQQPSSGWPVTILTPTAHPLEALAEALNTQTSLLLSIQEMVKDIDSHTKGLMQHLDRYTQASGATHSLLVIDQFEELFTLCRDEEEQAAFVNNLLTAALHPGGVAIVVIVMRADFYAHCARFDTLRQALSQHQVYIGQMTNDGLRRAIEEPARAGHWDLEPGLTDLLLHDVGADRDQEPEPGALPLLSHALLETWQRRRGRTLTLSGYTASGGVQGAITETAEAVFYDQLESEQRDVARQIFLRLTALGGDASTADTRRRVSFDELAFKPEDRQMVRAVLKTLADARLITIDQ